VGEGKKWSVSLGANGAGKSTTLKSVSGLLGVELGEVIHGSIEFLGRDRETGTGGEWPPWESARSSRDEGCTPT